MASGAWFRPPRPLLVAFLAFALAPVAALGWLGWRLLEQERALERQRAHERLQNAADRVAATLARQLTQIEGRLGSLLVTPDHQIGSAASEFTGHFEDALIVVLSSRGIDGYPPRRLREQLALAGGGESLWEAWQGLERGEGTPAGRQVLRVDDRFVLLLWQSVPERLVALVAGPRFLETEWLPSVVPAVESQPLSLSLTDAEGGLVTGRPPAGPRDQVVRTPADTGLPWTVQVAARSPGPTRGELLARWRFLLLGFAVMGAGVLAEGYFTLRAMSRELAVARLKSDFVGAVSHEFRTPLTALCQLAETFAQGRVADEAQRRQYYDLLLRETRRLRRLVEDLPDFGRMEGGVREYRSEPLDAAELARSTVADFQEEVARQGYRVELSGEAAGVRLRGDEEALRRALWNLLDNAVKYSPGSSTVWVDLSRQGRELHLRVWDQGLGIAEEEQAQVFRKFVRGASSRVAGVKGTGIGLSMVDHIVRGHRGRVTVESGTGLGSTFTVVLQLEE
jgi:signal transduction histidine kinase